MNIETPAALRERVGHCLVMGILNVTPDSFSDGGKHFGADDAIYRAHQMLEQGANIVDVGGESTRPGSQRISADEEIGRITPVIHRLASEGALVSVDTVHAQTAAAAADVGAWAINDVSGGLHDPHMTQTVAELGLVYIPGHWRGFPDPENSRANYADVTGEVRGELRQRLVHARAAGISRELLVADPGLGFDKDNEQNWELLRGLPRLAELGYPLLVGASRKRFLADLAPEGSGPEGRDGATHAVSALAAHAGAWGVRVHDVPATVAACRVAASWATAGRPAV